MYWRKFAVSSIPIDDPKAFEAWILERWREKDDIMEQFLQTGRMPPNGAGPNETKATTDKVPFLETEVKLAGAAELLQMYLPSIAICLALFGMWSLWKSFSPFRS